MDILSALGAGFLFALACNLDTVLAAVGQGAGGRPLGLREALAVSLATTLVTFLSLILGAAGAALLPPALAGRRGGAGPGRAGALVITGRPPGQGGGCPRRRGGRLAGPLSGPGGKQRRSGGGRRSYGAFPSAGGGVQLCRHPPVPSAGPNLGAAAGPVERSGPAGVGSPAGGAGAVAASVRKNRGTRPTGGSLGFCVW